jgi:hypothetical protein
VANPPKRVCDIFDWIVKLTNKEEIINWVIDQHCLHDTLREKIKQQKNSQIWLYILQQQENYHIYGSIDFYQFTLKKEVEQFGWCVGLVQKYITMCKPQVKAETAKKLGLEFISITKDSISAIEIPNGYCRVFLISPCCSSLLLNLSTSFAATDTYSRLLLSPWIVRLYILQQQENYHIYGSIDFYQLTLKKEVEQFGWCVGLVQKYITMCKPRSSLLLNLSTSFAATDTYSRLLLSPWIVNLRYSFGISIVLILSFVIEINSSVYLKD